jgi:hypothetical protein
MGSDLKSIIGTFCPQASVLRKSGDLRIVRRVTMRDEYDHGLYAVLARISDFAILWAGIGQESAVSLVSSDL